MIFKHHKPPRYLIAMTNKEIIDVILAIFNKINAPGVFLMQNDHLYLAIWYEIS